MTAYRLCKYILFVFLSFWAMSARAQSFRVLAGDTLDRLDADSLRQGIWQEEFADSKVKRVTLYKNGLKDGLDLEYYYLPHCLKKEAIYKNDTLVSVTEYYRDCRIWRTLAFSGGKQTGYATEYHRNGRIRSEGLYKDGELQGTVKVYDEKGRLKFETTHPETEAGLEEYLSGEKKLRDSIILKTLARMPLTENTTVVADVTGSMYPYIGQLLVWYRQQMENTPVRQYVFFNDGDMKPDLIKHIGSTGGIYTTRPRDLKGMKRTMADAIGGGGGGADPENDIEALLAALKKFKSTDRLVLIADRTSPVRDISLLSRVNVPVDVILCGSDTFTHTNYLDIAYRTGGKIYTQEETLDPVTGLKQGQTIRISRLSYRYSGGKFRLVTSEE